MSIEDVTALDATFLELEEADESAHMHIGSVALFEPRSGEGLRRVDQLRAELGGAARRHAALSPAALAATHRRPALAAVGRRRGLRRRQPRPPGWPSGPGGRARAARVGGRLLLVEARPRPAALGDRRHSPRGRALGDGRARPITAWSTASGRSTSARPCSIPSRMRRAPVVAPTGLDPELVPAPPAANSPLRAIGGATVAVGSSALGLARFGADVVRGAAAIATRRPTPPCTPSTPARRGTGRGRWPVSWSPTRWSAPRPPASTGRSARRAASPWSRSRLTT